MPVAEIAQKLGRHRSTIYRELSRNRFTDEENPYLDGYYGPVAQTIASRRRFRRRKLVRMPTLLTSVVDRLRAGWSPEQISGRLRRDGSGSYVCHAPPGRASRRDVPKGGRSTPGFTPTKAGNGGSRASCRTDARTPGAVGS
ncbi:helix-turn-helix domain-containing protein [Jannaschia sp.]|nr:helix-turn-helix domain-containing protein [Jannaschia sp.]